MKLKVSVAVLAHGDPVHLGRAIDSVLAQTYKNIEIIVVYDGLTDNKATTEIVRAYGKKVAYYQKTDEGVAAALNFAISKATGKYFSWLSYDDAYLPEKIEEQVLLADGENDVIGVSNWDAVNRNNRKIKSYVVDHIIEEHPAGFLAFSQDAQLNTAAMLFPLAMLKGGEQFNENFPSSRDYAMINRLIMAGAKFRVVSKSLLNYGSHSEDRYLVDPRTRADHDFIHSDLISTLSYETIIAYFGSRESAIGQYREYLGSGRPRSAAFLMERIIAGCLTQGDDAAAKETLLSSLSGLSESHMAADADTLLSKISQPSTKKKILFCSAHWLTGGMERVMSTLFRELKGDYEIFLITPYDVRESRIDIPNHVTSIKIADEHFQQHFDVMILSYALLLDIDVAIGFINLFKKQLNLYNICAGTKIKTIASNHEYYFYPYKSPGHYEVVEKRLSAYEHCDAIVWPNSFNAALCGMYVNKNYVIGNPNNFEVAKKIAPSKGNVVICVGRFNDYVKRIDRILESFSLILKKVPDAKLVLVGKHDNDAPIRPGERLTVNDMIAELALPPDSLNFVGEVSNVQDYYSEAKVLMLTSNSEGFGMVLNEAACFGVPSVCNYTPGIEDIISDEENGYITEQGDIGSIASRIATILTDDSLQRRLSENARKKATAYDSNHVGDKWRYLINSLVDSNEGHDLRKKLDTKLGYTIHDQQLFSKVLAKELNEIFYMSINEGVQHKIASNPKLLILLKMRSLPNKLRANIEYEGLYKTSSKIVTRAYRIARSKLKI